VLRESRSSRSMRRQGTVNPAMDDATFHVYNDVDKYGPEGRFVDEFIGNFVVLYIYIYRLSSLIYFLLICSLLGET